MASGILKQRYGDQPMPSQRRKGIPNSRRMEIDENVFKMECQLLYVHAVRVSAAAKNLITLQKDIRRKQRKVARGGISKHLDETKEQFVDLLSQCKGDALTIRTILDTGETNPRHQVLKRSLSEGNRRHSQPKQKNNCENCSFISQRSLELEKEKQKLDKRCLETKQRVEAMEKELEDLRRKLSGILDPEKHNEVTLPSEDAILSSVSDLYHREWSDAFRELKSRFQDKDERYIVACLLGLLMEIQKTCKEISVKKQVLTETPINSNSETYRIVEVDSKITKQGLSESSLMMENKRHVSTHLKNWLPWPELSDYIHVTATLCYIIRCMDVCWQMTNHNPRLIFDASSNEKAVLKPTEFRKYKREGNFLDFVVWPKVVDENGKVIAAGIAEGS
ncbi:hypothetical protein ACJMK2_031851 [Sinanodonta woodiana]|uniref:Mitochondria-eating protein C-terminal domain-containing protein n=1 Tax=Sinanodonta woodiana TaxID=1069815 RepID=A0ABD3X007_SINWO